MKKKMYKILFLSDRLQSESLKRPTHFFRTDPHLTVSLKQTIQQSHPLHAVIASCAEVMKQAGVWTSLPSFFYSLQCLSLCLHVHTTEWNTMNPFQLSWTDSLQMWNIISIFKPLLLCPLCDSWLFLLPSSVADLVSDMAGQHNVRTSSL